MIEEGVRPLDPLIVEDRLKNIGVSAESVTAIDSYKVIITFISKEYMIQYTIEKKEAMSPLWMKCDNGQKKNCARIIGCGWSTEASHYMGDPKPTLRILEMYRTG